VLTVSACAPGTLSARVPTVRRTVERMGDTRELECVGRGDGSACPYGVVLTTEPETIHSETPVYRCDDCRHYWELDETEPGRRAGADDSLSRPMGDPREVGKEDAA
jgi:hypothetical protein